VSFKRPTLSELIERDRADTAARLADTDPALRRSLVGVLSTVRAGALHGLYGYLDWLSRQLFPDTAEAEFMERWAGIWSVRRKPAQAASGVLRLEGSNGSAIPAGTVFQRADGVEYLSTAEAIVGGGAALVPVAARLTGAGGNADPGVLLSLVSPLSGVQSRGAATGGLTGGADEEADEPLCARLMTRIQHPPQAGTDPDYEAWALEVPGVTRAWAKGKELGPGTVTVRFLMDGAYPDGIPLAGDVDAVQAHIDAQRPTQADVFVVAPLAKPINPSIRLTPDTASVRAAVLAELADLLFREAVPGGTILRSHLTEAVSISVGEADHVLLSPAADFACGPGELAVLGTIDWGA